MMRRLFAFVLWMTCACATCCADDAPRTMLRAHLEPAGTVTAGSTVRLVVDALTTTWFSDAPDWPLFDLHDAFVTLPDENATNLNETIDGVHWFGVSRAYRIVPRTAGAFDVPSFAITLHPGGASTAVTLDTPSLHFDATLPPGAAGMKTFFPAPNVTATQRIEPADGTLEVGGTVTRIVTQRADATVSMLIPPLSFGDIDGLRRYDQPASTRDVMQDRAGLVAGERVDTASYVVERRGRYTLPPLRIEWWNTLHQRRETIELPGATFTAHAAREKPLWDIPSMTRHTVIFLNARDVLMVCIAMACLIACVAWYSRVRMWLLRASKRLEAKRKQRREGEAAAWRALVDAANSGIMRRVVPALYRWMDVSARFHPPARLAGIVEREAPPDLTRLAHAVRAHYASNESREAMHRVRLRRRGWKRARTAKRPALPPLNVG